jgi:hypothetical protein
MDTEIKNTQEENEVLLTDLLKLAIKYKQEGREKEYKAAIQLLVQGIFISSMYVWIVLTWSAAFGLQFAMYM